MKTEKWFKEIILNTGNDNKIIFLRLIVGSIFIIEGIMKYMYLEVYGPSFFNEIGFKYAFFWAYFTGAFEISCGSLILAGFLTRVASIPLLIIMITAFLRTKVSLLFDRGFWTFAHEYRIDFSLTILLVLLLYYGGGRWSVDSKFSRSGNS
jgi:putative oxidoreductase